MDARGHGMSEATADPKKMRSWVQYRKDLEAFVDTLSRPTVLAGHSMGATVSMELAAARPDLVQGLVLIDPVIVPPRHIPMLAVARTFGLAGRLIPISQAAARRRMEFPSREAAVENYVGKGPFRTWPREWIEAYVEGGTVDTEQGTVRLSCDRVWESASAREHDGPPFTRASRDAFMECQPGTRLLILEEATHFMTMEHPEIARAEIERMAQTARSELG
jgi:pimeloyl-ACP methyl ester carboxylesterase